ncbi:hypothetical protein F4782DRAFT_536021 [Xylaria castorea]|nr:hypothetical protein F4782DRAFT_536021 [Xylaria castorea]
MYLARNGVQACDTIPERSIAARAYQGRDVTLVRQLVDPFEASQQLTLTELPTIGLECLVNRETNPFIPADQLHTLITMVSAFASDWTVVLDGGFGATIDWVGKPIPSGYELNKGLETYTTNTLLAVGIVFFLIAFFAVATLPRASALRVTQSDHRPKPTTKGSRWKDDEFEALEPSDTPLDVNPISTESPDRDLIFTIIDTYSMTATLVRAVHPSTVALVCGQEGGMRKMLLCSYDYRTQTFHREAAIRKEEDVTFYITELSLAPFYP